MTGPVYMVIEDVPLYPIGLPFCFFPFSSSYSSGISCPLSGMKVRVVSICATAGIILR